MYGTAWAIIREQLRYLWAYSSAVERYVDIVEVPSSILGTPTISAAIHKYVFFQRLDFVP